jgi:heme a synthase
MMPCTIRTQAGERSMDSRSRTQVATWLLICCTLVFMMVVVGGVTRLTHSGLSIVEWQPIIGTLPPLTDSQWQDTFHKYQQTPEFEKVNFDMSLEKFKGIFWWEYFHRLLGRLIGGAFLLPFLYFLLRGRITGNLRWKMAGIFVLGGLQGAMGWYMVKSGLVDDPRVSHFRLTAHLGLALLIFAAMFWVALDLLRPTIAASGAGAPSGMKRFAVGLSALIFFMALSGGLVAGIRAGFAYNTFPLMNGHWIPPEILMIDPWYLNFFNNMATVQFDHRLIAWALAIAVPVFWQKSRGFELEPRARLACNLFLAMLTIQIALGISTLLLAVPVPLAAAHQAGAVLLFAASLWASQEFCRLEAESPEMRNRGVALMREPGRVRTQDRIGRNHHTIA